MDSGSSHAASSEYFQVYVRLRPNPPENPQAPRLFRTDGGTLSVQSSSYERR